MTRYGPYKTEEGYVIYVTKQDDGTFKTKYAHREVLEEKLGRELLKSEVAHHINGIRYDNRPDNLEVMLRSEHGKHHAPETEMYAFICPSCGIPAVKKARDVRGNRKKGRAGPFCSKECAGKVGKPGYANWSSGQT